MFLGSAIVIIFLMYTITFYPKSALKLEAITQGIHIYIFILESWHAILAIISRTTQQKTTWCPPEIAWHAICGAAVIACF